MLKANLNDGTLYVKMARFLSGFNKSIQDVLKLQECHSIKNLVHQEIKLRYN